MLGRAKLTCGWVTAGCSGSAVRARVSVIRQVLRVLSTLGLTCWLVGGVGRGMLRLGWRRLVMLMDNARGSRML